MPRTAAAGIAWWEPAMLVCRFTICSLRYRSRMMHEFRIGDLYSLVKFSVQQGMTQLD